MTSDGVNSYTWDRANRLLSMGGVDYQYDGEGRRVQQTVSSVATKYRLDIQPGLSVVLSETTGSDVTRNVFSPRGIHAQKDSSNNWQWIAHDGVGNVREVLDNNVGVLESRNYGPYGDAFGGTITSALGYEAPNFGFTGEQTDTNGQVYLRARYYNPSIGVFTALDPFEGATCRAMSLNGYSYVEGNPINMADPTGNFPIGGLQLASVLNSSACFTQVSQPSVDCSCHGFLSGLCPAILPPCGNPEQPAAFVTNTPRPTNPTPAPTPTPDAITLCEQKIMAVAVAVEVGNGGYDMALTVANIMVNRLRDSRFKTPNMEELIGTGQVAKGLFTGFQGSCPQLGDDVYNFYSNPSSPSSSVGDVPKNIGVAQQAVNAAWNRTSDPTNGSFTFLVSNKPDYIKNNLDVRSAALMDMKNYPQGCARAWMNQWSEPTDVNEDVSTLVAERVENNGVVLLYSNFVAPTTVLPQLGFAGCKRYCSDPNVASTCKFG